MTEAQFARMERDAQIHLRRANICNWLVCALHEAGIKVDSIDIREDGVCEWANIDVGRGIFKVNVTGMTDIEMMLEILKKMRGA